MARLQFKLRTLFWVMAGVSIVAGVAHLMDDAARRRTTEYWEQRIIGLPEDKVICTLGAPVTRFNGHYGAPPASFVQLHPIAKTLVFGQSGGEIYISFEPVSDVWTAFDCSYLPEGGSF